MPRKDPVATFGQEMVDEALETGITMEELWDYANPPEPTLAELGLPEPDSGRRAHRRAPQAHALRAARRQSNPQSRPHQKITKRTQRARWCAGGDKRVYR